MNFHVKSRIPALSNLCLVFTYLDIADVVKWVQYILVQRLIDTVALASMTWLMHVAYRLL